MHQRDFGNCITACEACKNSHRVRPWSGVNHFSINWVAQSRLKSVLGKDHYSLFSFEMGTLAIDVGVVFSVLVIYCSRSDTCECWLKYTLCSQSERKVLTSGQKLRDF